MHLDLKTFFVFSTTIKAFLYKFISQLLYPINFLALKNCCLENIFGAQIYLPNLQTSTVVSSSAKE